MWQTKPFVGRDQEMVNLRAVVDEALAGRGGVIVISGEPGIGKTRTAQEVGAYAADEGARVLWGRCYEEQGVPPYWPWVLAIRSYVQDQSEENLRSEIGSAAAVIAEIVPDVKERLGDSRPPPVVGRDEARFRLLDSVTSFLKSASKSQPIVVVLDDLHWADDGSLSLLQFTARELADSRLLVVGTYRDVELNRQHPLAETLAELTREGVFSRVLLRGLTSEDIRNLLHLTSGIEPPRGLVAAVNTETEGNPLFVTEVLRLLVQEGELTADKTAERESWEIRIPEGVREVIGRRLNRLSQPCNEVLTVAAVVGREFDLPQVSALIEEMTDGTVLDALEEALTARVIEEIQSTAGRYEFTHALIQETLTDGLSLTRRVRLHARIAETLESLCGDRVEDRAAELAHHLAQAETLLGTEKLFKYSLIAGGKAFDVYAYEDAEAIYAAALAAADPGRMDGDVAALLTGIGKAQGAALKWAEGWRHLARAFDYYAEAGDRERAVDIATFPDAEARARGLTDAALPVYERALEMAEPDSVEVGLILCNGAVFIASDYEGSTNAFEGALKIARATGDEHLEMRALFQLAEIEALHLNSCGCLERSTKAAELARRLDDPRAEALAQIYVALGYLGCNSDIASALEAAQASLDAARRTKDRHRLPSPLFLNGLISRLAGNLDEALDFHDQSLEIAPRDLFALWFAAMAALVAGKYGKADTYIEALAELYRAGDTGGFWDATLAECIALRGWLRGTEDGFKLAQAAANSSMENPDTLPASVAVAAKGRMALVKGDSDAISWSYNEYKRLSVRSRRLSHFDETNQLLGILRHCPWPLRRRRGPLPAGLRCVREGWLTPRSRVGAVRLW